MNWKDRVFVSDDIRFIGADDTELEKETGGRFCCFEIGVGFVGFRLKDGF